jgi:uncharacterized protein (DUF4415 family)
MIQEQESYPHVLPNRLNLKRSVMMKTIENKSLVMTDEDIAALQNFETKDFRDCPIQTPKQLKTFKPKSLMDDKPVKKTVSMRLDEDVLEWLKQAGSSTPGKCHS